MKKYINDIINLLNISEELDWKNVFENLLKQYPIENKYFAKSILKLYGGMGSFNDLVLFKNGKLLKDENEKLDILRKKLYNSIEEYLSDNMSN